ncbi:MAG: winged helix-turn-helix domain-containing protein [Terracidiphilus sp.]|nr:winged helix-turn-helix domain-containing protein [Terracidiphilus sp.]
METAVRPDPLVHFKNFELNICTRELYRNGLKLKVQGHPIDVLVILLERPGELVTREALRNRLWPADTFVDFEHGLNNSINRLRETLGDRADEPRFIETLPRLGYRFIAPVQPSSPRLLVSSPAVIDFPAAKPSPETPQRPAAHMQGSGAAARAPVSHSKLWKWAILGSSTLIGVLAFAFWFLHRPLSPPHITAPVQITSGGQGKDLIATDGRALFLNLRDLRAIAQMPISGGPIAQIPVQLPGFDELGSEPPGHAPRLLDVSPDGSRLLILDHGDAEMSEAWVVGVSGQPAHYLTKARSAAWSHDGKSIVYATAHGDLNLIPAEGGEPISLISAKATAQSGQLIEDPSFSPDGSRIRFTVGHGLWEVAADGSNLHGLLEHWHTSSWKCCGRWTPNGEFFLFLSGETRLKGPLFLPGTQLWAIDERSGHLRPPIAQPIQLTTGPTLWGPPIPARGGHEIFSRGVSLRSELVQFDKQSHQLLQYLGGRSAEFVDFSQDGNFVAFVSFPEGILWRANRDGSGLVQLTQPPFYPKLIHWSPDGSQILFTDESPMGLETAYVVSSRGGTPMRVLPEDNGPQQDANWSPDGTKVVLSLRSDLGAGPALSQVIRILDLGSHKVSPVPDSEGMSSPRWSPDGRFIAALTTGGAELKIFDLQSKGWKALNAGGYLQFPVWSKDSRSIYALLFQDHGVFQIPINGQKAERVIDLKDFRHTGWYGLWLGLDPGDAPILLRDLGEDEIYQLTLE